MKASLAAARQATAAESVAERTTSMQAQLDRIEAAFNALLEALAHDAATDNQKEVGTNAVPKRGRPTAVRS